MKNSEGFCNTVIDTILASTVKMGFVPNLSSVVSFMPVWYHQLMVAEYSRKLALALEMRPAVARRLFVAGLFHDISKIFWNGNLHTKPYRFLSDDEKEKIRMHPKESVEILINRAGKHKKAITAGSPSIVDIIMYHHEKPDGSGYYNIKLDSKEIAILSISDIFEACTENRPYRTKPMAGEEAAKVATKVYKSLFNDDEIVIIRRTLMEILYNRNLYRGYFDAEFAV